eukprot:TRINITY_DN5387_c1_g1_i1.p1 TRINITY_DN5387_c1_g1~~TRINITY_DN5387_c1_g1_i1.p1  ORF type:complete len:423 (+),score=98.32 TRINITY_DN5387_c1_g1_i1:73-1269(+)
MADTTHMQQRRPLVQLGPAAVSADFSAPGACADLSADPARSPSTAGTPSPSVGPSVGSAATNGPASRSVHRWPPGAPRGCPPRRGSVEAADSPALCPAEDPDPDGVRGPIMSPASHPLCAAAVAPRFLDPAKWDDARSSAGSQSTSGCYAGSAFLPPPPGPPPGPPPAQPRLDPAAQRRAAAAEVRHRALQRAWAAEAARQGRSLAPPPRHADPPQRYADPQAWQPVCPSARRGDHAPPLQPPREHPPRPRRRDSFGTLSVRSQSSASSLPFDVVVERSQQPGQRWAQGSDDGSSREIIRAGSDMIGLGRRWMAVTAADAAREDAAAAAVQRCWRHYRLCRPARQRLATRARGRRRRQREGERRERRVDAATRIQAVWRGCSERRALGELCGHEVLDC